MGEIQIFIKSAIQTTQTKGYGLVGANNLIYL